MTDQELQAIRQRWAEATPGSQQRDIGSIDGVRIAIGCMDPSARDLLDRAMEQWGDHRKSLPAEYQESVYSFAYWLFRWSGLVNPHGPGDVAALLAEVERLREVLAAAQRQLELAVRLHQIERAALAADQS